VIRYGDPVETCPACPFCSGSDFCGRIPVGLAGRAVIPRHYATVATDQEEISRSRGKKASSRASPTEETEEERHRKAA